MGRYWDFINANLSPESCPVSIARITVGAEVHERDCWVQFLDIWFKPFNSATQIPGNKKSLTADPVIWLTHLRPQLVTPTLLDYSFLLLPNWANQRSWMWMDWGTKAIWRQTTLQAMSTMTYKLWNLWSCHHRQRAVWSWALTVHSRHQKKMQPNLHPSEWKNTAVHVNIKNPCLYKNLHN